MPISFGFLNWPNKKVTTSKTQNKYPKFQIITLLVNVFSKSFYQYYFSPLPTARYGSESDLKPYSLNTVGQTNRHLDIKKHITTLYRPTVDRYMSNIYWTRLTGGTDNFLI